MKAKLSYHYQMQAELPSYLQYESFYEYYVVLTICQNHMSWPFEKFSSSNQTKLQVSLQRLI